MPGRLTVTRVADPYLIGQAVWESLPAREQELDHERQFSSWDWGAFDRRRFRIEPQGYRTESSVANVGGLRAGRVAETCATQFTTRAPVADAVWITLFERGAGSMVLPGSDEAAVGNVSTGFIRASGARHWAAWSDDNIRLNLSLPAGLLRQKLGALLDGQKVESIAFQPIFDQRRGGGATIHRMIHSLFAELAESDSLLTNELVIRGFEEHLVLCLLLGLPHSQSERLLRQRASAAPANVKRAEEFMCGNAAEAVTIEMVAQAAGCSVRALQLAFRQFRNITPMEALRRIRLEQARDEIARSGGSRSVMEVAAKFGFTNPGRFSEQYKRTFGELPSDALRRRALHR
jgi:AraC-like DNA-binding protein